MKYTFLEVPVPIDNKDMMIKASALIFTPKQDFKEWIKTAATKEKMPLTIIDETVTKNKIEGHALAFITPIFETKEQADKFYARNSELMINFLLSIWPFNLSSWPAERSRDTLDKLFDCSYYLYLLNMLDVDLTSTKDDKIACSVIAIKPKKPVEEWLNQLIQSRRISISNSVDVNYLRHMGVALLTPSFESRSQELEYVKNNYELLFEIGLSLYSHDENLWPKKHSYDIFCQWFDCIVYSLPVDLTNQ